MISIPYYRYGGKKQGWETSLLRLHVISSYAISTAAISTAAISTIYTFNRSHFQPLAFSTACKFNRHKFDLFN